MKIRALMLIVFALSVTIIPADQVMAQASKCVQNRNMSESTARQKIKNYLIGEGWRNLTLEEMTPEEIEKQYLCKTVQRGYFASGTDGEGNKRTRVTYVITAEGKIGY